MGVGFLPRPVVLVVDLVGGRPLGFATVVVFLSENMPISSSVDSSASSSAGLLAAAVVRLPLFLASVAELGALAFVVLGAGLADVVVVEPLVLVRVVRLGGDCGMTAARAIVC